MRHIVTKVMLMVDGCDHKEEGSRILSNENRKSKIVQFAFRDISDITFSYLISRIRFKSEYDAKLNPFGIEFNMIDGKRWKSYRRVYRGVENNDWFERGSWGALDLVVIPPFMRRENDSVRINVFLKGNDPVQIDTFSIEVFDPSFFSKSEQLTYYNDYNTIIIGNRSKATSILEGKGYELVDSTHQYSSTLSFSISELDGRNSIEIELNANLEHNYSGGGVVVSVGNEEESCFYNFTLSKEKEKIGSWNVFLLTCL